MKKRFLIAVLSLISSMELLAQNKNNFSINYGEIYLTDWKARYGAEYGASYSYIWFDHLSSKISFRNYYQDITSYISSNGIPLDKKLYQKNYVEGNLCFGYFLIPKDSNIMINIGAGLSYRRRVESFIVAYGVTASGFPETITNGYTRKEFGGVINFDLNYLLLKRFSLGVYSQLKLYPNHIETLYPEIITHKTPNSVSYGLACGFNF